MLTVRPKVAELVFQLYGRPLHPELFDIYHGGQLPPGKKSLAFSLTYQAMGRSLTSDQVAQERQRMIRQLERQIGARLRE